MPVLPIEIRPAWMEDAACAGQADATLDPWHEGPILMALRICAGCPVRPQCLDHALKADERRGIWGGLLPEERTRIRLGLPPRKRRYLGISRPDRGKRGR